MIIKDKVNDLYEEMAKEDKEKKVVSQQHWKESILHLTLHADKLGHSFEHQFLKELALRIWLS